MGCSKNSKNFRLWFCMWYHVPKWTSFAEPAPLVEGHCPTNWRYDWRIFVPLSIQGYQPFWMIDGNSFWSGLYNIVPLLSVFMVGTPLKHFVLTIITTWNHSRGRLRSEPRFTTPSCFNTCVHLWGRDTQNCNLNYEFLWQTWVQNQCKEDEILNQSRIQCATMGK